MEQSLQVLLLALLHMSSPLFHKFSRHSGKKTCYLKWFLQQDWAKYWLDKHGFACRKGTTAKLEQKEDDAVKANFLLQCAVTIRKFSIPKPLCCNW